MFCPPPLPEVRIELRGVAIVCWDPDDDVARVDPDHASAGGDVSKEVCFCKRITLLEKGASARCLPSAHATVRPVAIG